MRKAADLSEIVSLCLRRGFFFQSADIYGGLQGVYDYGPLGVELKRNLQNTWWKNMTHDRDDIEGLDSSILTHDLVLRYSSHESTFSDLMVDCRDCKKRMRADHIVNSQCDFCGSKNLTEPRPFNLMFRANFGPVHDNNSYVYLRPETAQGIFTNFRNVLSVTSRKLPFGIAQSGKAFRNEITPRNFIFRVREFEQMELEFFVVPGSDMQWHEEWVRNRHEWWLQQGLSAENLRLDPQKSGDLAHYSKATTDILYHFPHGWEELEGIANRTDFDLGSHSRRQDELGLHASVIINEHSTTKLTYIDQIRSQEFVPFVIEPSFGIERGVLALLSEAYCVQTLQDGSERTVLKLRAHLAPIKVAVIPLAKNNQKIISIARKIYEALKRTNIGKIKYEDIGNVGKAYRRHDEIGTPLCITVDFETVEAVEALDQTFSSDIFTLTAEKQMMPSVTIRDRDSMTQKRIAVSELAQYVSSLMSA